MSSAADQPVSRQAARVLEKGGSRRFRARLATLGHHFGGKASSWRDAEGRIIDHGQHIVVGWYYHMKGLLVRAGLDVGARLVSAAGHTYVYESRDDRVHDLALKRNPFHVLVRSATHIGKMGGEIELMTASFARGYFVNGNR
ncbi:MAG: hypothetical protein GY807_12330 [Gammaproteobacteria bacterium]|nr:hypothetical protein [Gammaproteobacteria bacterium]